MPDFSGTFSEYMKAVDLGGAGRVYTIESARLADLKDQNGKPSNKPALKFQGVQKELIVNKTNYDIMSAIFGSKNTDHWIGQRIALYPHMTNMGEGIAVRSIADEKIVRAIKAQQDNQGAPRQGGVNPQQTRPPQAPGPRPVAQLMPNLPPDHDPNYVQTTLKQAPSDPHFDNRLEQQYRTPVDDLMDDNADIPFENDDLGDDL